MAAKRESLHARKLRPKSVVGMGQGAFADDILDLVPRLSEQSDSNRSSSHTEEPGANEEDPA